MNHVTLIGHLSADPDIRYTQNNMAVARYRLAVDRPKRQDGTRETDWISCICFDKRAQFAERFLHKGMKIAIEGEIRTGSYTAQDGRKVYTTDVVVNNHEFCEARQDNGGYQGYQNQPQSSVGDGFAHIPEGVDDDYLPFN